jgi:hypothetical protein
MLIKEHPRSCLSYLLFEHSWIHSRHPNLIRDKYWLEERMLSLGAHRFLCVYTYRQSDDSAFLQYRPVVQRQCRGPYDTHNSISRCNIQQQCEDWSTATAATAAAAAAATATAATGGKIYTYIYVHIYIYIYIYICIYMYV